MKKVFIFLTLVLLLLPFVNAITNVNSCRTLNVSGSYQLNQSLVSADGSTCINITSNNIYFNLNGFAISNSTSPTFNGQASIYISNETVSDLNISVINGTLNYSRWGIYLVRANGTYFNNLTISYHLKSGLRTEDGSFSNITNNVFQHNLEDGLNMQGSHINYFVSNNTFYNNSIGLENNAGSNQIHNDLISNNKVYQNNISGIIAGGANDTYINNLVYNNNPSNVTFNGIDLGGIILIGGNLTFINNTVYNDSKSGIKLFNIASVNIDGNRLIGNTIYNNKQYGIYIDNATSTLVYGNTAYNNTWEGLMIGLVQDGKYTNVTKNNFTLNEIGAITFSNNTHFHSNNLTSNYYGGILVESSNNQIFNTNASYNNPSALSFNGTVFGGININLGVNNSLKNNYLFNNTAYGVYINDSRFINISNGTIQNSQIGISSSNSSNITITNNTLFNISSLGITSTFNNYLRVIGNFVNATQVGNNYVFISFGDNYTEVINNTFINYNGLGVAIQAGTVNATILNNNISFGSYGLSMTASTASVINNSLFNQSIAGIFTFLSTSTIRGNLIYNNVRGIHEIGSNDLIINNSIFNNTYGLFIDTSNSSVVTNNSIFSNTNNLYLNKSCSNTFNNNFLGNIVDESANCANTYFYDSILGQIFISLRNSTANTNLSKGDTVLIENNFVAFKQIPALSNFNNASSIGIFNLTYSSQPWLLRNELRCDNDSSLCSISVWDSVSGKLYADVSGWGNYSTTEAVEDTGVDFDDFTRAILGILLILIALVGVIGTLVWLKDTEITSIKTNDMIKYFITSLMIILFVIILLNFIASQL